MDIRKTTLMATAALFFILAASCNKDKDKTTTSLSFTGALDFTVPAYVNPGDIIEAEPRGMNKDTVDIGYYWTVHLSGTIRIPPDISVTLRQLRENSLSRFRTLSAR